MRNKSDEAEYGLSIPRDVFPFARARAAVAVRVGQPLVLAALIVGILMGFRAHAQMSCYVNAGSGFDAPANGDTLCWADSELPKSAVTIEREQTLSYMCDPTWYACSPLSGFEAGGAGPGGGSPGPFFRVDSQFRINPGDPCCAGAVFGFRYDPNAKPTPAHSPTGTNAGPPSCSLLVANPVHAGTGNNYEKETDYVGTGPFPLRFERHYNSILGVRSRRDGWRWKHTYERSVFVEGTSAVVLRETGRNAYFEEIAGAWVGRPNVPARLERLVDGVGQPTGWRYLDENDSVEVYDDAGVLQSITTRDGFAHTLTYDVSGQLVQVMGPFGRTLTLTYDPSGRWETMSDPAGNLYRYTYNADGNLDGVTYPDGTPADQNDNPKRQYHYDDAFNPDVLTGITDENGNTYVTWGYDSNGRVTFNSRAGGADSVTIEYDDAANTSTVTDALGEVRTYSFEGAYDRIQVSAVTGSPCTTGCGNPFASYTYDANGYPASRTDHNGNLTTYTYNSRGLETSRTEAVGRPEERTISTQWHATFRLPILITEPGKTAAFAYDASGRLLSRAETDTASGATRTVTNTYNAQGLLASRDGPRTDASDVTTFAYDAMGNLTETMNPLGHVTQVTAHDPHGRPLVLEEPNGLTTTISYDARGRMTSRDVGGRVTTIDYDGVGNVTKTTLPDSSFLISEYDAAQRLIAVEDNLGNRTEFTLDAAGNRIEERVRAADSMITRTRTRVYNALNRLVREVGGAGQQIEFEYDLNGNQTAAVVDAAGLNQRTTNKYDGLNRLARSIDPNLGATALEYDGRDNLVSVTDAEDLTTTYAYDGLENLVVQSSTDTGITRFAYDDAGNGVSRTDARGVSANFTYDALNRLESIQYPDGTKNVEFEYDQGANGIGRMTRMTDESGSTDFVYDTHGNLLSETRTIDGVAYATAYTYDAANRVLTTTYPSGTAITYTRDALGRIDSVSATTGTGTESLASNIRYLPFGPMNKMEYGNGIPLSRTFDQDYRLIDQIAGIVQHLSIGYDPADNITSIVDGLDAARSQSFVYDKLNRLTQGQGIYGIQDYTYDAIGNRLSLGTSGGIDTYSYDPSSHRLDAILGPGATTFAYDANGNTVAKGPLTFSYDDTNRMKEAMASGVVVGEYAYNGKGERVKKTAGGTTTVYHYDNQGQLIAESDATGAVLREYVYLNGAPLALLTPTTTGGVDIVIDNSDSGFNSSSGWESKTDGTGAEGGEYLRQRTNSPPAGGILVDDTEAILVGKWKRRSNRNAIGSAFHRAKPGPGDATATWSVPISAPGDYRVFVTWKRLNGAAPDVPYTIAYSGGSTTVVVDQSQPNNTWVELGVFSFSQETVTIGLQNTPNGKAIADAVYVVRASGTAKHYATWDLNVPSSGDYEIYVKWPADVRGGTKKAGYTVKHLGGSDTIVVNQRINGNQWIFLGKYAFARATGQVTLTDEGGRKYVLADAVRIVKSGPLAVPGTTYFYHNDHLGTPQRLTDSGGAVSWMADYEPFGNIFVTASATTSNLRFPGQYFDEETSLHYNYFRDYHANTGRYLSSDPIGLFGGLNLYSYASNNPLRFIDPQGLEAIIDGSISASGNPPPQCIPEADRREIIALLSGAIAGSVTGGLTGAGVPGFFAGALIGGIAGRTIEQIVGGPIGGVPGGSIAVGVGIGALGGAAEAVVSSGRGAVFGGALGGAVGGTGGLAGAGVGAAVGKFFSGTGSRLQRLGAAARAAKGGLFGGFAGLGAAEYFDRVLPPACSLNCTK